MSLKLLGINFATKSKDSPFRDGFSKGHSQNDEADDDEKGRRHDGDDRDEVDEEPCGLGVAVGLVRGARAEGHGHDVRAGGVVDDIADATLGDDAAESVAVLDEPSSLLNKLLGLV